MNGIEIRINGVLADTDGISFTRTRNSPVMDIDGSMKGDYVYNINFRITPTNEEIFNHPKRFSLIREKKDYAIICKHFGTLLFYGTLSLVSAANSFETNVKAGSGEFWYMLDEVEMKSLDLGTLVMHPHQDQNMVRNYAKQANNGTIDAPVKFPMIFAPEFYGSVADDGISANNIGYGLDNGYGIIGKYINNWDSRTNKNINNRNEIKQSPLSTNVNTLVPMLQANYILDLIFKSQGYIPTGKFFSNPDFDKLLIGNNQTIDKQDEEKHLVKVGFTSTVWNIPENSVGSITRLYPNDVSSGDFEDTENCFDIGTGNYTCPDKGWYKVFGVFEISDNVFLSDATYHFQSTRLTGPGGSALVGCKVLHAHYPRLIQFETNPFYIDFLDELLFWFTFMHPSATAYTEDIHKENSYIKVERVDIFNTYNPIITIKDHLPDMPVKDFIKSLCFPFGLAPFIHPESSSCELLFFDDIINAPDYVEFSDNIIEGPDLLENETTGLFLTLEMDDKQSDTLKTFTLEVIGSFDKFEDVEISAMDANKCVYIRSCASFYAYLFNEETYLNEWTLISIDDASITTGKSPNEMKAKFFAPTMIEKDGKIVPSIHCEGISELFKMSADKAFFLLNYCGMQPDINGVDYPFATSQLHDIGGNELAPYKISFNHEKGFNNKFLKSWIYMKLNSSPIRIKKRMTAAQLSRLDFSKKHRVFGIDYIIRKTNDNISQKEYIEVEITLDSV